MGMSSSLNASVAGLSVNSSRLAAIADNIANSGTDGYKRAVVDFASVVTGQIAGKYQAGGVRSTSYRQVDQRGALLTSNNPTDIAITGRGLLPVTPVTSRGLTPDVRPLYLVSTGSFTADDEGYLRTASGLQLLGWPTDANGSAGSVVRASGASLEPVRINGFDFASNPTTNIELGVNLPSADTGTAGTVHSTQVEYYDDLGAAQTLTLNFTTTATANEWVLTFGSSADATITGATDSWTMTFNDTAAVGVEAGSINTMAATAVGTDTNTAWNATTGELTITLPHGPVTIDMGVPDSLGNLTQFSSSFAPVGVTKDGTPVGGLNRVEVTEFGYIEAVYDTGFRQTIYQIPVADVPYLNGLTSLDNQAFAVSNESGNVYLWDAGQGPVGEMAGYSLEQSATDIADELTNLIETQRAYSSNAKVVQTVDEMLQETTNLKR
ncbi:MAG: flagellar hook-basal body complex protein [Neomegalonema sp.]|nr:flagellar hook-basal body complex protein [Neomegalonema sp.]